MKKLYFLSIILGIASINAASKLNEKQRQRLENAQWEKAKHQQELARTPVYKMVDAAIEEKTEYETDSTGKPVSIETFSANWPSIFNILDSMQGVISVNEYGTFIYNYPLLWIAIKQKNALATKTLLEKYKANPNVLVSLPYFQGEEPKNMTPLMLAREQGDNAMVNLLIKHGAK